MDAIMAKSADAEGVGGLASSRSEIPRGARQDGDR